ncbi:MAG TPA: winged helix-turn-helix domain-containing protein [Burkholderiales bacterium]|nr:winged helix-turn-helix domain-containing protein [Burkholderiales bacterium]
MREGSDAPSRIEFGRFAVVPLRRELLADGRPVELGGRAFEVLMALIEARGTVLSKDDLIGRVWPGRVVEENNLQVQIATLRKVFARDRGLVRTVAGRGYQFTGEVHIATAAATSAAPLTPPTNLPQSTSDLIGRDAQLGAVDDLVRAHRLVTLVGPGGIGKTRLSLEIGRQLLPRFAHGVWVAELGPLSDPDLVPVTVATALGLTLASGTLSPGRVAAALASNQVLLVLDNCEHVIEAAARMAEAFLRTSPGACVLATSREPLRVPGEYVHRVPPLELPEEGLEQGEEVLRAAAVELFVARARAADPHFSLDLHAAAIVAAICRRLDGIPLAIELAAARTPALGVGALAARLDDRFRLLTGGVRTALPRHQTLRATLDWSYELLPESERVVLRRLAVFAGDITLESAGAIAGDAGSVASDVVDRLGNLVTKSLVTADVGHPVAHYRLLDTTRAYALEKLTESGELEPLARRHAEYHLALLERAGAEWDTRPTAEWLAAYGRQLDNVRAALDWASSPRGDRTTGVALTVAAVPLWIQLSLMDECHERVETALANLAPGSTSSEQRRVQLFAALGLSLLYTKGNVPETVAAWTSALELAERLDDTEYQLRALFGLWTCRVSIPECQAAQALAEKFLNVARRHADPINLLIGDRMIGVVLHYQGDQTNARHHIEGMLSRYVSPVYRSRTIRFQIDQQVAGRAFLARILWLQGFADQALRCAQSNVEEARAIDHPLSLCYALEAASAVALFAGDLTTAEDSVATLLKDAERHGFGAWHAWGGCFRGVLHIKRGEVIVGTRLLGTALDELRNARFAARYTQFLGALAEALGRAGQTADGLAAIDEALARSERNEERWCIAELLRIKGELVLLERAPSAPAAAEGYFQQGLDGARRQGALSWELRCATSLARLWQDGGQTDSARKLLERVYGRFSEGFGTADLVTAATLLSALK